jgi:hypothetical protein
VGIFCGVLPNIQGEMPDDITLHYDVKQSLNSQGVIKDFALLHDIFCRFIDVDRTYKVNFGGRQIQKQPIQKAENGRQDDVPKDLEKEYILITDSPSCCSNGRNPSNSGVFKCQISHRP